MDIGVAVVVVGILDEEGEEDPVEEEDQWITIINRIGRGEIIYPRGNGREVRFRVPTRTGRNRSGTQTTGAGEDARRDGRILGSASEIRNQTQ